MIRIGHWQDFTAAELTTAALEQTAAVLSMAAVEQHGPHLPLSTDVDIGDGILERALEKLAATDDKPDRQVLVLPAQRVGASPEHAARAGTLSLAATETIALLEAIGASVAATGVTRLVIFNSHGGNSAAIDIAALNLRRRCGLLVVKATYFDFAGLDGLLPAAELAHGIHGGAVETAMMMHLAPEKVRTEYLPSQPPPGARACDAGWTLAPAGEASYAWLADDLGASGVAGNAALADAELGKRLVEHHSAKLATILAEACVFEPGDWTVSD